MKLSTIAGRAGRTVGVAFVLLLAASFVSLWLIESDRGIGDKLAARISGAKAPDVPNVIAPDLLGRATPPRFQVDPGKNTPGVILDREGKPSRFDPAGIARQLLEREPAR